MDNFNEQFNEAFQMHLEGGSDRLEKLAADTSDYVKVKIREESWSRKIQPMKTVGKSDIEGNLVGDGFHIRVEVEPDSKACILNLKAQPEAREIEGRRVDVNFFTVSTERLEKTQNELLSYKMPITKVLQENNILDMQEQEDSKFYGLIKTALVSSGLTVESKGALDNELAREDLKLGLRLHSSLVNNKGVKLKTKSMLMTEFRFADVSDWDSSSIGDKAGEITEKGWTTPTLFGKTLHVTNKNDTKAWGFDYAANPNYAQDLDNEVLFFTSPDYMGKSYLFEALRFWIGKEGRMVYWESWEDIAQAIINDKAVARLTIKQ